MGERKAEIKAAIIKAFDYHPLFTKELDFQIEISQSLSTSQSQKTKLATSLYSELGASDEWVSLCQTLLDISAQSTNDTVSRSQKTKLVLDLLSELNYKEEWISQYKRQIEFTAPYDAAEVPPDDSTAYGLDLST